MFSRFGKSGVSWGRVGVVGFVLILLAALYPVPVYTPGPVQWINYQAKFPANPSYDRGDIGVLTVFHGKAPHIAAVGNQILGRGSGPRAAGDVSEAERDGTLYTNQVAPQAAARLLGASGVFVFDDGAGGGVVISCNSKPVISVSDVRGSCLVETSGKWTIIPAPDGAHEVPFAEFQGYRPVRGVPGVVSSPGFDLGATEGSSSGAGQVLALMDSMSRDNLVRGHAAAVTGTVTSMGNIKSVGGVPEKLVAASRDGATVAFVPDAPESGTATELENGAPVVRVSNVQDIIDWCREHPYRGDTPVLGK